MTLTDADLIALYRARRDHCLRDAHTLASQTDDLSHYHAQLQREIESVEAELLGRLAAMPVPDPESDDAYLRITGISGG